jgi:hypothetical protein
MTIVSIIKNVAKFALILGLINYVAGDLIVEMLKQFGVQLGTLATKG